MRVRYTRTAIAELEATYAYLAQRNPAAAVDVVLAIERIVARLTEFPESAVKTNIPNIRVAVAYPHPYLIFYGVVDDMLIVRNIRHAARRRPSGGPSP